MKPHEWKAEERFMMLAINKAKEGIEKGQTPFAACIVKDNEVVAVEHNNVWKKEDITAHAEICAIRGACKKLKTVDLSGCVIYSTTEPCPMCFSAIHWAKIGLVIFGAKIEDAKNIGFNELEVSNRQMKELGKSEVDIVGGFMKEECLTLFDEFLEKTGAEKIY